MIFSLSIDVGRVAKIGAAIVIGAVVLKQAAHMVADWRRSAISRARRAAQQRDVVYLHVFPRLVSDNLHNSAPCLKVESFLRMYKVPYEVLYGMNNADSPTERLPFIELNGVAVAESAFIIEHVAAHFKLDIKPASSEAAGKTTMLRRLTEDSLRLHYYRHLMVDNWRKLVPTYAKLTGLPVCVMSLIYTKTMRPRLIATLNLHGQGDLTDAQYHAEFLADVKAIESQLTTQKFAVSDEKPTVADCSVFAWLQNVVWCARQGIACPAVDYAAHSSVINAYLGRMEGLLYPDKSELLSEASRKLKSQRFN